ncbi:MAG: selenide, water dikinase SelD [Actinobacteria bacterium]|nr:selenide, water dikinase SelD [Actinomycetota bacterium]
MNSGSADAISKLSVPIKLTEWTSCGGCAAKWGASLLTDLVSELANGAQSTIDPALLVGLAPFDDAAVYQVSEDVALVSTTDFFPPLVDDPDDFGAISAANACSDVFAMGGRVVMAVNIAAFPEHFPREAISIIFAAAARVVAQAGGSVAGGHTIRNPEPIFGLAVQGVVDPKKIFRKAGAKAGDVALLSKPLGTGLTLAAGTDAEKLVAIAGMRQLNRQASEQLQQLGAAVHGVTDVTGYGLAGHGWEMAQRSGVQLVLDSSAFRAYPGALEAAQRGVRTGGDPRNRTYVDGHFFVDEKNYDDDAHVALCMDPQTSGGLLAAVTPEAAEKLLQDKMWWRVGEFAAASASVRLH